MPIVDVIFGGGCFGMWVCGWVKLGAMSMEGGFAIVSGGLSGGCFSETRFRFHWSWRTGWLVGPLLRLRAWALALALALTLHSNS
jgi:hypothetical protein